MLVQGSDDGLLQPFIWNYLVSMLAFSQVMMCGWAGMWGLFWYNDGGEMMQACLTTGMSGADPTALFK